MKSSICRSDSTDSGNYELPHIDFYHAKWEMNMQNISLQLWHVIILCLSFNGCTVILYHGASYLLTIYIIGQVDRKIVKALWPVA